MNPILRHRRMIMSKRIRHTDTVHVVVSASLRIGRYEGFSRDTGVTHYLSLDGGSKFIPYSSMTWYKGSTAHTVPTVSLAARDVVSISSIAPSAYVRSCGDEYARCVYSITPNNGGVTISWTGGSASDGQGYNAISTGSTDVGAPSFDMTYYID